MGFDRDERLGIVRERAGGYVETALGCVGREFPHMPWYVATGPGPYPSHRELHPAFYGSFDWHSCVEMHWVVVRLLKVVPEAVRAETAARARGTLGELLTAANLEVEARFFRDFPSFERPYGWGWLLTLAHELETWEDADGRAWGKAITPLAELLGESMARWLGVMTYPQRTGVHQNTAFGLSRALDWATARAEAGDGTLLGAIRAATGRWFLEDVDYPARWEPSGADFLSAALCEAELVSRILPAGEFPGWLERFLPGLEASEPEALFWPAAVADESDGQMAHLHGLNLSRAWAFTALAERLPEADRRIGLLVAGAERNAVASLPVVSGSDYMVERWLAAYATLLLGEGLRTED